MQTLFSTSEASEYLEMTTSGLWYHIKHDHLMPAKVGKTLVFTKEQLDEFQAHRRPAGRPKKETE